jgi:hypothetical protein
VGWNDGKAAHRASVPTLNGGLLSRVGLISPLMSHIRNFFFNFLFYFTHSPVGDSLAPRSLERRDSGRWGPARAIESSGGAPTGRMSRMIRVTRANGIGVRGRRCEIG